MFGYVCLFQVLFPVIRRFLILYFHNDNRIDQLQHRMRTDHIPFFPYRFDNETIGMIDESAKAIEKITAEPTTDHTNTCSK